MDFQSCPECDTLNPPGVKTCEQCKAVLPEVPDFAPPPPPAPEPEPEPAPSEAVDQPFEAAPEVLARVQQLEAQIEAKPNANALYLQLCQIYAEAHRKDLAIRTLERCLEHDPKNVYIRHRLSQLTGFTAPPVPAASRAVPGAPPAIPQPPPPARAAASTAAPPAPPPAPAAAPVPGHAPAPAPAIPAPPVAAPVVAGSSPSAPRPASGPHSVGGTHSGRRPVRPVAHRARRRGPRRSVVLGGVLALAALGVGAKLLLFPGPRCVVTGRFSAVAPEWSPSGKQFAFLMQEGERTRLAVHDLDGGEPRPLADVAGFDGSAFAWSPDGRRIAYVGTGNESWEQAVYVIDVESGQSRHLASGSSPSWTSDGSSLLMWCGGAGVVFDEEGVGAVGLGPAAGPCRVDVASGAVSRGGALPADVSLEWGAAVSPVLGRIAFERMSEASLASAAGTSGSLDGEFVEMVDSVAARKATNVAEGSRDLARELEARQYMERRGQGPDDGASGLGSDIFVVDFLGGAARQLTTDGRSGSPTWTADGTRILYRTGGELWLMDADGGNREPVVQSPVRVAPYSPVALTPDGRHALFVARVEANEGLAQLMTGETPADLHEAPVGESAARRLANRHSFKQRFALSPDGRRIVYEVIAETGTLTDSRTRSELWMMSR